MLSTTAGPVVDLRDQPGVLRKRLREADHEIGFCYLIGHGLAESLVAKALEVARRFFALPQADKEAIAMVHSPHFRGCTPLRGELTRRAVDWREQIDIGPSTRTPATLIKIVRYPARAVTAQGDLISVTGVG